MFPDVLDMRRFYNTPLGQSVSGLINKELQQHYSAMTMHSVLGLGYASPFLKPFQGQCRRVISAMPAQQGVLYWPEGEGELSSSLLVDEAQLPFSDSMMDYVILSHILEHTTDLDLLMEDVHRILAATGKLVLIVPNRRGLWAQFDNTPLGYGRPYSPFQIEQLLQGHGFQIETIKAAIFMPPSQKKFIRRISGVFEKLGRLPFPLIGGVLIAHARKDVYAPISGKHMKVPKLVWRPQLVPKSSWNRYN